MMNVEMKLKGSEFWVLEDKGKEGDKRIFDNLDDAVKSVKTMMENDVDPESIVLATVDIGGDEWKIKQVPWSEIAVKLVKIK
jgi:hypothetical protein